MVMARQPTMVDTMAYEAQIQGQPDAAVLCCEVITAGGGGGRCLREKDETLSVVVLAVPTWAGVLPLIDSERWAVARRNSAP